MRVCSILTRALTIVGASILMASALPAVAQAQSLWGGDSEWGGKRTIVSFNTKYRPGQLIASFGDRRLYYIT